MFCNRQTILRTTSIVSVMAVLSTNVTANAAGLNPGLKASLGKIESVSTSLSDISSMSSDPILDWRNPKHIFEFDLSDTNWTTALSVVLSVDPLGQVDATAPIYMRLNDGKEIRLKTKGRGFDARITLNPSELRETGNKLAIYLGTPSGEQCFLPQHGQWSVDLRASSLKVRSRAKGQNYTIEDLKDKLENPLLKPKDIGLIVKGSHAAKHQALLAQSIGLHLEEIPRFTTTQYTGDLDFIIGQHDEIKNIIKNKKALQKNGPRIFIDSGRPLRVVLTGQSEKDVERAVRAFAQYQLPRIGADYIDSGLLSLQPRLTSNDKLVTKTRTPLSQMGNLDFDKSWQPGESHLTFDVQDPSAAHGEIILKLNTPKTLTGTQSDLTLSLNGRPLGKTTLDKKRKSVSFQVPKGVLKGQNNLLKFKPHVQNINIENCSQLDYQDNALFIEPSSNLTLAKNVKTPIGDVSHMMATGAPFANLGGEDTLLVLPKNTTNFHTALSMLAKFAQSSGKSWAYANITRDERSISQLGKNKNILFITPSYQLPSTLKSTAPKTLKLALNGLSTQGARLLNNSIQKYASNDIVNRLEDTSPSPSSTRRINQGGVAALYESPFDKNKIVGIITNTPQHPFERAMRNLKQSDHWNAIEGSVARWDKNTVLMTGLPLDLPNFIPSTPDLKFADTVKHKFNEMKASAREYTYFEWPEFDIPDIELPKFSWPEFATPGFKLPPLNFGSFGEEIKADDSFEKLTLREIENGAILSKPSQSARIPLDSGSRPKALSNDIPQIRKMSGLSFLDKALAKTRQDEPSKLQLKGLSRVTDNGVMIDRHSSKVKTVIDIRLESIKTRWTNYYRSLPLFTDNTPGQYEYRGTDQTLNLLILLTVLSLGGLLISLGFSGRKRNQNRS